MRVWIPIVLVVASLAGCKRNTAAGSTAKPAPAAAAAMPAGEVTGKVLERLDAAPYTYLRLQVGGQELWAAVPQTALQVGQDATLVNPMEMGNFESKTLKRTFPSIVFANLKGEAGAAAGTPGAPMPGAAAGTPPHPIPGQEPDAGDIRVAKAAGAEGRTIAEVHAQRDALKEKTVAIQGKVVKVNAGILGRNWLHLRDGSGSQGAGNHDLTVTTQGTAAVGDVVTARGVLRLNKDFGSGYNYPLILEDATLKK